MFSSQRGRLSRGNPLLTVNAIRRSARKRRRRISKRKLSRRRLVAETLEPRLLLASDPAYTNAVLADNPVAYYAFDEVSGVTAADTSGSTNSHPASYLSGALLNQTSVSSGLGGAVDLDGVSAVRITDHSDFDFGVGDFAIELWFRPDSPNRGDLFTYKDGSADLGIQYASQGAGSVSVYLTDSFAMGPSNASQGGWHHLVATRESGLNRLYIDGAEVDTFTNTGGPHPFNVSNDLLIGANHFGDPDDLKFSFDGPIDELAIYDASLSASRVAAHFNAGLAATSVTYGFDASEFVVPEGASSHTNLLVSLSRSSALAAESVDVVLQPNSATAGVDYQAGPVTVDFAIGELQKNVPIQILGDSIVELNETVALSLNNFTAGGIANSSQPEAALTIANDDVAAVSIASASNAEDGAGEGGTLTFDVTLSNPVDRNVQFDFQTINGGAQSGQDYQAASGQLTIASGATTAQIEVALVADERVELDESLTLQVDNLQAQGRQVVLPGSGDNVVINGDFELPLIDTVYETVNQGADRIVGWSVGGASVDIAAPASGAQSGSQVIDLAGTPGPGALSQVLQTTPGVVYDVAFHVSSNNGPFSNALNFKWGGATIAAIDAPNEGQWDSHAYTLTATANTTLIEFVGLIGGNQGATLDSVSARPRSSAIQGIIENDDKAQISIIDGANSESDSGAYIVFDVELTKPVDHEVVIDFQSVDDVAVSGGAGLGENDFVAVSGTLQIEADSQSGVVSVYVNGDNLEEADEGFYLDLVASTLDAGGRDVKVLRGRAHGTVQNDDAAPALNSILRSAFVAPLAIDEGDSLSLDASQATDADDGAAAISFRWDVDGDGDFDENLSGSTLTLSASQLAGFGMADGPFSTTLTVEMTDGTNVTRYAKPLEVKNRAANFDSLSSSASDLAHKSLSNVNINGVFSDPAGDLDTHQVEVDWGDGEVDAATVDQTADSFGAAHNYARGGIYTIVVTLTDSDGAVSTSTTTAVIVGAGVVGDTLFVIGTEQRDDVRMSYRGNDETIYVSGKLDGQRFREHFDEDGIQKIEVYLCAGDDKASLSHRGNTAIHLPALIDAGLGDDRVDSGAGPDILLGGPGNDRLYGRAGDDVVLGQDGADALFGGDGGDALSGGAGNDWLFGDRGRDLLIGGIGSDVLLGGCGEDLIVGGSTSHAENVSNLQAALTAWSDDDLEETLLQMGEIDDDDEFDFLLGGRDDDLLFGGDGDVSWQ